jgi:pyruvate ferredoxin oxidoreductase beta subunit
MNETPISLSELRRKQPRFSGLESGHRACLGCGQALAARLVTEAAGPDVMLANATGCLEVFTTPWPESAWRLPWLHSLFENAGAIASGMEAAMKAQGKATKVIAMGGDGSTFDIVSKPCRECWAQSQHYLVLRQRSLHEHRRPALQLHAAFRRYHYLASRQGTHGQAPPEKRHHQCRRAPCRLCGHRLGGLSSDLRKKVRRAMAIEGATFLQIHAPSLGWGHDRSSIEVARLAVQWVSADRAGTRFLTSAMPHAQPVSAYLKMQQRFGHCSGRPRALEN